MVSVSFNFLSKEQWNYERVKLFFFFSFNIILKNRKVGVRDKVRGKVVGVIAGRGMIGNYMKPAEVEWCLSHAFCRTSWLQQSMPIMVLKRELFLFGWRSPALCVCVISVYWGKGKSEEDWDVRMYL